MTLNESHHPKPEKGIPWRRILFFGFSLAVTVVVFRALFHRVSWLEIRDMMMQIDLRWFGVFVGLSLIMHLLRTLRYRMVLRASGENPAFLPLLLVVVVRGMCVDMLPSRLGELVYLFLVRTRLGIGLGAASASFALAFLFDLLALAPLVVAGAWLMGAREVLSTPVLVSGGMVLLLLSLLLIRSLQPLLRFGQWLIRPFVRKDQRWAVFLHETADSMSESLHRAKDQQLFWPLLGVSLLVRSAKYAALYVMMLALLFPQGYEWADLPLAPSFMALVSGEMAASLPASGIGGFGAYEGTLAFVMALFGHSEETAAALSISHRLITQVYGWVTGLLALGLLMLPCFHVKEESSSVRSKGSSLPFF